MKLGQIDRNTKILFACVAALAAGAAIWCVVSWTTLNAANGRLESARENLTTAYRLSAEYESLLSRTGTGLASADAEEFNVAYYVSNLLSGLPGGSIEPASISDEKHTQQKEGREEHRYRFVYNNLTYTNAIGIWYLLEKDGDPRIRIGNVRLEPVAKTDAGGATYTYRLSLTLSHFRTLG